MFSRQEVTKLFDDSISAVINAFEQQRNYATIPITVGTISMSVFRLKLVTLDGVPYRWIWSERLVLVTTRVIFQVPMHRAFPSQSSVRTRLLSGGKFG